MIHNGKLGWWIILWMWKRKRASSRDFENIDSLESFKGSLVDVCCSHRHCFKCLKVWTYMHHECIMCHGRSLIKLKSFEKYFTVKNSRSLFFPNLKTKKMQREIKSSSLFSLTLSQYYNRYIQKEMLKKQ